jgi:hypothetical protein
MGRGRRIGALAFLLLLAGRTPAPVQPFLNGVQVFPPDNPWNWDIRGHAVHPNSANFIATIGSGTALREDYAFHYVVVPGTQPLVDVAFTAYPGQSDPGPGFGTPPNGTLGTGSKGRYPIPPGAPIEPGADAHVLVVEKDTGLLYETYATSGGPPWSAACGAVFDLNSNALRPDGFTSADAAGLPIFPGLIRWEEVQAGAINHALRFTCGSTRDEHWYPARHDAGSPGANRPPMGLRVRMKAGVDLSGYTGAARVILEALKKHGLILADNGSNWYISTTIDDNWAASTIRDIRDFHGSDFEVVQTVDGSGNPIPPSGPFVPPAGGGSGGGGGGCGLTGWEPLVLLLLSARSGRPRRD